MSRWIHIVITIDATAIIAAAYAPHAAWRAQNSVFNSRSSLSLDSFNDSHDKQIW